MVNKGLVFLTSSGGMHCVNHLKELNIGKNQCHISLWDNEFVKPAKRKAVEEFETIGTVNRLFFQTEELTKWSTELLNRPEMDTVVVHGGNTRTIINEINRLRLDSILRKFAKERTYVGISAGIDVAFRYGIVPDSIPSIRAHWNLYEENPDWFDKNVHGYGQDGKTLHIHESIKRCRSAYLMFDNAYLLCMFEQEYVVPYGKIYHLAEGQWHLYENGRAKKIKSPL